MGVLRHLINKKFFLHDLFSCEEKKILWRKIDDVFNLSEHRKVDDITGF